MCRNKVDHSILKLVVDAQQGNRESLGVLAEQVEGRLQSYLYRLTLDQELAQELCQQTIVSLIEKINALRQPEQFWFWLFRTAMGHVQHHFRDQKREHKVRLAALDKRKWEEGLAEDRGDGLDRIARVELTERVMNVIMQMRLSYRNILVLRCFEQMSYAEIAELMDCKELRIRVLFFRAKHALRQQLARQGVTRTTLATGLTLFGILSTHSKGVSVTVSAATLDVGVMGTLVGALGTKFGIILTSCLGTLLVGLTFQKLLLFAFLAVVIIFAVAIINLCLD
jgi:RNA polymerase sigma-70 factor (ECF subfamily)